MACANVFLAGAGLTVQEHHGVGGRDLLNLARDPRDGGAPPRDLAVPVDGPDLGLEVVALCLESVLQPFDLRKRLPQRLFPLPHLRVVADHAVHPLHAPLGIARRGAGDEVQPPLPAGRVQEAELDGSPVESPLQEQLAPLQDALPIVGVHSLENELHDLHPLLPLRGHAHDVARPGVDEGGPIAVVHLVVPETGELGTRLESRLALAQRLLVALALRDVDGKTQQALRLAGGAEAGPPARGDPADAAVGREDDPVLQSDRLAVACGVLDGLPNEAPVLGMDRRLEALHLDGLVRRVPEDRAAPLEAQNLPVE